MMTKVAKVVMLGGASETARAAKWLAQTTARAMVFWADEASADELAIPSCKVLSTALTTASGIVDATHPFDTRTRAKAVKAAPQLPYARIWRAPWVAQPDDCWTEVDTIETAVQAMTPGARVFAATGRHSLPVLAKHEGPVFLRQLKSNTDHPPDNCEYVYGAGPFDTAGEIALFSQLGIDVVLARNVGADGSFPKLAAARQLGLPVILLRPPTLPQGTPISTRAELAEWISSL